MSTVSKDIYFLQLKNFLKQFLNFEFPLYFYIGLPKVDLYFLLLLLLSILNFDVKISLKIRIYWKH